MLLIAWLSLLIWLVLLFGRGGFWRAQALERLSESTVHAVGQAEIARRGAWPAVVAIVPARNEADVIGRAVTSLLAQDYAGSFHLIVVDDHSTDGTADAAQAAARDGGFEDRLTDCVDGTFAQPFEGLRAPETAAAKQQDKPDKEGQPGNKEHRQFGAGR